MKKKCFITLIVAIIMLVFVFVLAACDGAADTCDNADKGIKPPSIGDHNDNVVKLPDIDNPTVENPDVNAGGNGADKALTLDTAYIQAAEFGYAGSREEFVATVSAGSSADVDVQSVSVNDSGNVIVTLTNGKTVDLGAIVCVHRYSDWEVGIAPTCSSLGYNLRICDKCGDKDYDFIEATGHVWDDGKVVIEPLCYKDGTTLYNCTKCGAAKSETAEMLGHNYVNGVCDRCKEIEPDECLRFYLNDDGTHYIVDGKYEYQDIAVSVVIPSVYNGISVKEIYSSAFSNYTKLRKVVISEGIETISDHAFRNCGVLESVSIPEGVTRMGNMVFMHSSIQSIHLPQSLTSIGRDLAIMCENLDYIEVAEGNPVYHSADNCLIETESKAVILGTNNSVIPKDGSVTSIKKFAFMGRTGLTSINIPSSITQIESRAFERCYRLAEVYNYSDLDIVAGSSANGGGVSYYALYVYGIDDDGSKLISTADGYVFDEKDGVYQLVGYRGNETDLTLPSDILDHDYTVRNYAFYGTDITSVVIPDSLADLGTYTFKNCRKLRSVQLGSGLNEIGVSVFESSGIESIVIPDSIAAIGMCAFCECENLRSVQFGKGITKIGYRAFDYSGLQSIVLPDSVTEIGSSVFDNCASLESVILSKNITAIPEYAFERCKVLRYIELPEGITVIGQDAFSYSALESIVIPNSVTQIGQDAFYYCRSLKKAVLGKGITEIPAGLFRYCGSLEKVNFVGDITLIGNNAFYKCESLKYVVIPESVTQIGKFAFFGCDSLKNVIFEDATGWSRTYTEEGSSPEAVAEETIADTEDAAKLLKWGIAGYYSYSYVWMKQPAGESDNAA